MAAGINERNKTMHTNHSAPQLCLLRSLLRLSFLKACLENGGPRRPTPLDSPADLFFPSAMEQLGVDVLTEIYGSGHANGMRIPRGCRSSSSGSGQRWPFSDCPSMCLSCPCPTWRMSAFQEQRLPDWDTHRQAGHQGRKRGQNSALR